MKFSTRTTYGLRALIRLAKNWPKKSLSLGTIAQTEKISLKYLERIFSILKKAGIVISVQGSSGGYRLAKAPNKIVVYDIIKALEGGISAFSCMGEDGKINCRSRQICGAVKVLAKVQIAINKTLKNIKLSNLI